MRVGSGLRDYSSTVSVLNIARVSLCTWIVNSRHAICMRQYLQLLHIGLCLKLGGACISSTHSINTFNLDGLNRQQSSSTRIILSLPAITELRSIYQLDVLDHKRGVCTCILEHRKHMVVCMYKIQVSTGKYSTGTVQQYLEINSLRFWTFMAKFSHHERCCGTFQWTNLLKLDLASWGLDLYNSYNYWQQITW